MTLYVAFIAYDEETGIEVSKTVQPSEGGVLLWEPHIRDIWAEVDRKLQQERQKNASQKPQKARIPKRRPTKRPVARNLTKSNREQHRV